ncbi:MAG TPA: hypothetical protein PKA10_18365 [Selenomonadales bacterium]|nr:hypothetical protein [Selenomonadales bacterium]
MPYIKGTATDFGDLLTQVTAWTTDTAIHGDDAWELMRSDPWPRGTILKAKGLNEENHCYIGLLPLELQVGKTYKEWLLTHENLGKYIVWSANGINKPGCPFTLSSGNNTINVRNDRLNPDADITTYILAAPEIVAKNCKALVFGVFKQYAANLNWDEQPGAISFGDIGLISLSSTQGGVNRKIRTPLYPGIGYPGMGMDYTEPKDGFFQYWATKDANRLTVVIQNGEQWDLGHAGLLIPYHSRMQYPFPAVAAGSHSGLILRGDAAMGETGAMVDYTYANWTLTRGMPPFAGVVKDIRSATSQVGLCLPDGSWQFFANWLQGASFSGSSMTLDKPVRPANVDHYIKPTCISLENLTQVFPMDDTYQLEPLELIQDVEASKNIFGRLWGMFWPSREIYRHGEARINGKLHLILPNSYRGRPWYIYNGTSGMRNMDQLLALQKEIDGYNKQMNCVIRLED